MHSKKLTLTLAVVVALSATAAQAVLITVPTDLNPGDQYRLVFTTASPTTDAISTDIADYNAFVDAAANSVLELAGLSTTWKVIGSTATVAARDNTGTNPTIDPTGVPIYTLADTRMADTNTDLWNGTIDAVPIDNFGNVLVSVEEIWTGSSASGIPDPSFPLGGGTSSVYGRPSFTNSSWFAAGFDPVSLQHRLYAMSGVLTVVPEPSSIGLAVVAGGCLLGFGLRRRRTR
jgi:PEP-CTERM motif